MKDITLRIPGKWVKTSLLVFTVVAVTAAITFAIAPLNELAPSYSLHTFFRDMQGLQPGSQVDLEGIPVGHVSQVRLGPRATDGTLNPSRSIEIVMCIEKRYQPEILSDSQATPEVQGLLGSPFVSIRRGLSGRTIPDGGEIPSFQPPALEGGIVLRRLVERFTDCAGQPANGTENKTQINHR